MGSSSMHELPPPVATPPSTPPKRTVSGWKAIPGVSNPNVKYIPGKTLLQSMHQQQSKGVMQEEGGEETGSVRKADSRDKEQEREAHRGYSIETRMDDMTLSNSMTISNNIKYVQKEFLSSSPGDQMLILCVIFDLDNKGEGAGDVQLHLGSLRMDLSNGVLASLLSPLLLSTLQDMSRQQAELAADGALSGEAMVVVDWSARLPLVRAVYDRMCFQQHLQQQQQADGQFKQELEPYEGEEKDSSEPIVVHGQRSQQAVTTLVESSEEEEARYLSFRKAMLLHRNMAQWLSLLQAYLPKVMSLSFCLNTVLVQSLDAAVLRDLIHAKLHTVLDK
jgi:hypothetical protein